MPRTSGVAVDTPACFATAGNTLSGNPPAPAVICNAAFPATISTDAENARFALWLVAPTM